MIVVVWLLAAALACLGLVFVVGAQGQPLRIVIGVVLMAAAGVVVYLSRLRPKVIEKRVTVEQKIDLSGDVEVEQLSCRSCSGSLGPESVTVRAGAVFVDCSYCGTSYQIEEAPKW